MEYVKKFMTCSALLSDMAKSVLIDALMNDLDLTIVVEVRSRHPVGLEGCMREA